MKERYYLRFVQTRERVVNKAGYVYAFDKPEEATGSSRALKEHYGMDTCVCPVMCNTNYLPLTPEECESLGVAQGDDDNVREGGRTVCVKPKKIVPAVKRRIRIRKA